MIKRIDFVLSGSVDFSLTDSDIWGTKLSEKRITSTSDFSLVPQRFEFTCVYDSNIAKLFNPGNEYDNYNISKFIVKYYEEEDKKMTGIIDMGMVKRDYRSNTVKIIVYDFMRLLRLMDDMTTQQGDGSASSYGTLMFHLDHFEAGWLRKIEDELGGDVTLTVVDDATPPSTLIETKLFNWNYADEAKKLGASHTIGIENFMAYGVVITDYTLYRQLIFWGNASEDLGDDNYLFIAFAKVFRIFKHIQFTEYDYYGASGQNILSLIPFRNFLQGYGINNEYVPSVTSLATDGGTYSITNSSLYWNGELYPPILTVSKTVEKPGETDKYVKYYDIMKAGLLLYNYFIYVDSDGNYHLENKDVSDISVGVPTAISISADDVFNKTYVRLNKQEVPTNNLNVLSGDLSVLSDWVDQEYTVYFQDKVGIEVTVKELSYNIVFLDQISIGGVTYRVAVISRDIDSNEYKITAWEA